jgi:enoyl-CoA hydratase
MIRREVRDGVAVLTMDHGRANALDMEFTAALTVALRAEERSSAGAAVLTGSGNIFSAGVDLLSLVDGGSDYVARFLGVLREFIYALLEHPKPLVAAVNGHAIAGGCVMTCGCDHRIMVMGKSRIGVPELLVGVPFPTAAVEAMRLATPAHLLHDTIYSGRTFLPEEALARGLLNELVEPEVLLERAVQVANRLAAIPAETFRLTKCQLRAHGLEAVRRAESDGTEADVAATWASDEVLDAVRRYVDHTLRKKKV